MQSPRSWARTERSRSRGAPSPTRSPPTTCTSTGSISPPRHAPETSNASTRRFAPAPGRRSLSAAGAGTSSRRLLTSDDTSSTRVPLVWSGAFDASLGGRTDDYGVPASGADTQCETQCGWLRGMFANGRRLGAFALVHDLWTCWLLRFLEKQARHEALPFHGPPDHPLLGAGGGVGLLLCRRHDVRNTASARLSPSLRGASDARVPAAAGANL